MAGRVALALVGILMLTGGAEATVRGAEGIAVMLGISKAILGLTIVAAGTALPEAATSIVAAIRGQRDIAVGNIIGSNIFNVLGVLGLSAAVAKGGVGLPIAPELLRVDIPIMIAVAVGCLPIFVSGHMISRREGFILFTYYLAYLGYYWLKATGSPGLQSYQIVVVAFLVPLTVWYIFMSTARHVRHKRWGGDVPPGRV
jgi:cation:H+ antiporter